MPQIFLGHSLLGEKITLIPAPPCCIDNGT